MASSGVGSATPAEQGSPEERPGEDDSLSKKNNERVRANSPPSLLELLNEDARFLLV